jgi:hypothetical protein
MKNEKMKKRKEKYLTSKIERNVMRFDRRRIAHKRKTEQDDDRTRAERHTGRKK